MPLTLTVVTPSRPLVEVPVDSVVLPGAEGEFGVLPEHEAFLAPLKEGILVYQAGGRSHSIEVAGGFAEVTQTSVNVLADDARLIPS